MQLSILFRFYKVELINLTFLLELLEYSFSYKFLPKKAKLTNLNDSKLDRSNLINL